MEDDELKEQLRKNIEKANEFLEQYNTVKFEIKSYYENLSLKYDETGKKPEENDQNDSHSRSRSTGIGSWLDKIISRAYNSKKK